MLAGASARGSCVRRTSPIRCTGTWPVFPYQARSWQVTADVDPEPCPRRVPALGCRGVTVRLLTNIGRLWTGSEVWSNAAILSQNDRIAWVGPASELPASIPGVLEDIVDVDQVENLGG